LKTINFFYTKEEASAIVTVLFHSRKKMLGSNLGPEGSILVEFWLSSILPDKVIASV
jgi:hypothetical protein